MVFLADALLRTSNRQGPAGSGSDDDCRFSLLEFEQFRTLHSMKEVPWFRVMSCVPLGALFLASGADDPSAPMNDAIQSLASYTEYDWTFVCTAPSLERSFRYLEPGFSFHFE